MPHWKGSNFMCGRGSSKTGRDREVEEEWEGEREGEGKEQGEEEGEKE